MMKSVPAQAKFLLLVCAVGLVPIALSYGVDPAASLGLLYGIEVENINLAHIMRAVMGLYLAMVVIWVLGAFKAAMTRPALYCCAFFMLGLASGRILSLALDGFPHWLLLVFTLLEIMFGGLAVYVLKNQDFQDG